MPAPENLYSELRPSMAALATPLFELSEKLLRANGNFLPHAAVLTVNRTGFRGGLLA